MGLIIGLWKAADWSKRVRLLGIDFASIDGCGSQFKVGSTMFRTAKPESFILVSPSKAQVITLRHPKLPSILNGFQVGQQNALECLPLVMESFSRFYASQPSSRSGLSIPIPIRVDCTQPLLLYILGQNNPRSAARIRASQDFIALPDFSNFARTILIVSLPLPPSPLQLKVNIRQRTSHPERNNVHQPNHPQIPPCKNVDGHPRHPHYDEEWHEA